MQLDNFRYYQTKFKKLNKSFTPFNTLFCVCVFGFCFALFCFLSVLGLLSLQMFNFWTLTQSSEKPQACSSGPRPWLPFCCSPTQVIFPKLPGIPPARNSSRACISEVLWKWSALSLKINWSPNNQENTSKWEQNRQLLPTKSKKERGMCPVPSSFISSATCRVGCISAIIFKGKGQQYKRGEKRKKYSGLIGRPSVCMCYLSMIPSPFPFPVLIDQSPKTLKRVINSGLITSRQPSVSGLDEPVAQTPHFTIKETEAKCLGDLARVLNCVRRQPGLKVPYSASFLI